MNVKKNHILTEQLGNVQLASKPTEAKTVAVQPNAATRRAPPPHTPASLPLHLPLPRLLRLIKLRTFEF